MNWDFKNAEKAIQLLKTWKPLNMSVLLQEKIGDSFKIWIESFWV